MILKGRRMESSFELMQPLCISQPNSPGEMLVEEEIRALGGQLRFSRL